MQFTWDELIDRARLYIDDDHDDTEGYISRDNWLTLGNVEYAQLYRRWVRTGLIGPAPTDTSFTGPSTTVTGALAILGVAEDLGGGQFRLLAPLQSTAGRAPVWDTSTEGNPGVYWTVTGSADNLAVTLEPRDTVGTYVVRWIPTVAYATDASTTIDLPYGGDERLVLGMAKRSKLKEGARSAMLDELIMEADRELNFTAFQRALQDSPRVRRVARQSLNQWPTNPALYRYY